MEDFAGKSGREGGGKRKVEVMVGGERDSFLLISIFLGFSWRRGGYIG